MFNNKLPRINREFLKDSDFVSLIEYLETNVWLEIQRRLASEIGISNQAYTDLMFSINVLRDLTQNSPDEQA